jgi:hypothetical protein
MYSANMSLMAFSAATTFIAATVRNRTLLDHKDNRKEICWFASHPFWLSNSTPRMQILFETRAQCFGRVSATRRCVARGCWLLEREEEHRALAVSPQLADVLLEGVGC